MKRNSRFRFVLAFCAAVWMCGCSGAPLAPQVSAALDVAECQIAAVRALVPHVETADAVVAAARVGDYGRAVALLRSLKLSPEQVSAVAAAFDACVPAAPTPAPEAPPPAALTDA